jgi:TPR repeat protein
MGMNRTFHWSNERLKIIPPRAVRSGIAMRAVLAVALVLGFGCSAVAGEKPLAELLAVCDQVAASPFDKTRPAGIPGVSSEKIMPETAIAACQEAATAAPDDARVAMQLGRAYQAAKNFEAARIQYVKASQQGNAVAAANLASLYATGQGGPKDDTEAVRLSRMAADQGNAQGQNFLGRFYQTGRGGLTKDDAEAVRFYKLAADQGNPAGQTNLGIAYISGLGGLPKDEREAVRLFKLSADQGSSLGQASLGLAYHQGIGGLPHDDREAARLYKLAADQGNVAAQEFLARLNGAQPAAK